MSKKLTKDKLMISKLQADLAEKDAAMALLSESLNKILAENAQRDKKPMAVLVYRGGPFGEREVRVPRRYEGHYLLGQSLVTRVELVWKVVALDDSTPERRVTLQYVSNHTDPTNAEATL